MAVKPISPDDIAGAKLETFPDVVFLVVNALIASNFTNGRASFTQEEVIERLAENLPGEDFDIKRNEIFKKGWLNFEEVYRAQGWEVEYDKPDYTETRDANFTFRKPKPR
jgi:hypothetical protein